MACEAEQAAALVAKAQRLVTQAKLLVAMANDIVAAQNAAATEAALQACLNQGGAGGGMRSRVSGVTLDETGRHVVKQMRRLIDDLTPDPPPAER